MIEFTYNDIERINPQLLKEQLLFGLGYSIPFRTEMSNGQLISLQIDITDHQADIDTIIAIISAHNPDELSQQEQLAILVDTVRAAAKENAKAIPSWARWTVEEAEQWYVANVSGLLPVANLADANTVLAHMATAQWASIQMLLALRNETWPSLEAGGE